MSSAVRQDKDQAGSYDRTGPAPRVQHRHSLPSSPGFIFGWSRSTETHCEIRRFTVASFLILSLVFFLFAFPSCYAQEASYQFLDRLLSQRNYDLSPSGDFLFIVGKLPSEHRTSSGRYGLILQKVNRTGVGPSQNLSALNLKQIRWSRRVDKNEFFAIRNDGHLYKGILAGHPPYVVESRLQDVTPPTMEKIKILLTPQKNHEYLIISGAERTTATRGIYRCNLEFATQPNAQPNCELISKFSDGIENYLLSHTGQVAARLRWNSKDRNLVDFQIPQKATDSNWRTIYSYDPSEDQFTAITHVDHNRNFLALSNRDRKVIALVQVNLSSGKETIITEHEYDIGELFKNNYTNEVLATSTFSGVQEIKFLHLPLKHYLQELLATTGQPARVKLLSSDATNRRFVITIRNAQIGYTTVLVYEDGKFEYLDGSVTEEDTSERTAYISPRSISIDRIRGPSLRAFITAPSHNRRPVPFVIMIQGGPRSQYRWNMHPLVQRLVSQGIAVLQLNHRGSSGYNREYEQFILHDHMPFESMGRDVAAGYEWIVSNGIGKPDHAGLWGNSFGATVAAQIASRAPHQYKAIVLLAGVFDFRTFINYARSVNVATIRAWRRYMGARNLDEILARGAAINPCNLAAGLQSPTLIMAGTQDRIAHPDQALALHDELRARGTRSHLRLSRHGHQVTSRRQAIKIFGKAADFFYENLFRDPMTHTNESVSEGRLHASRAEQCIAPRRSLRALLNKRGTE